MRARQVGRIFRRHFLEVMRDRRLLIALSLGPVIAIGLLALSRTAIGQEIDARARAHYTVLVEEGSASERLIRFLRGENLDVVEVPDLLSALRHRDEDVAVEIPPRFDERLARGEQVQVRVLYVTRTPHSQFALGATRSAFAAYGRQVLREHLAAAGLPEHLVDPVPVVEVNLTTPRERSGLLLSSFLPILLVAYGIGTMFGLASDVTVGEKERGTAEALLAAPLRRPEIAAGKWLIVTAVGLFANLLLLGTAVIGVTLGTAAIVGGQPSLPLGAVVEVFVAAVCLVAFAAAVLLPIGFLARSLAQAHAFMSPVLFAFLVPTFVVLFVDPPASPSLPPYAAPVVGPLLLMRDSLAGISPPSALVVTVAGSAAGIVLTLWLAARAIRSERVLLRGSS